MRHRDFFVPLCFSLLVGCAPLGNKLGHNTQVSQPNLALLGTPAASDEKAAHIEQIRREKGISWPKLNLIKIESTIVDGIYAYTDSHGVMFLVDDTVSFAKFGSSTPWQNLGASTSTMPMQEQNALIQKAYQALISYKSIIPMKFGNGNKRKFIYFTAPDCPWARKFDKVLISAAKDLDVTLYTYVTSIHNKPESRAAISDFLCATNPQREWFKISGGQPPKGRICHLKPLYEDKTNDFTLMALVPSYYLGTPSIVAEDGTFLDIGASYDYKSLEQAKANLIKIFGEAGKPSKTYF